MNNENKSIKDRSEILPVDIKYELDDLKKRLMEFNLDEVVKDFNDRLNSAEYIVGILYDYTIDFKHQRSCKYPKQKCNCHCEEIMEAIEEHGAKYFEV